MHSTSIVIMYSVVFSGLSNKSYCKVHLCITAILLYYPVVQ